MKRKNLRRLETFPLDFPAPYTCRGCGYEHAGTTPECDWSLPSVAALDLARGTGYVAGVRWAHSPSGLRHLIGRLAGRIVA